MFAICFEFMAVEDFRIKKRYTWVTWFIFFLCLLLFVANRIIDVSDHAQADYVWSNPNNDFRVCRVGTKKHKHICTYAVKPTQQHEWPAGTAPNIHHLFCEGVRM